MTTEDTRKILSRLINAVAHHDKNLWRELKRQIFEFGYQSYYPRQQEFVFTAKQLLINLPELDQKTLIDERRKRRANSEAIPDTEILLSYVDVIVENVVERARSAACRTENW